MRIVTLVPRRSGDQHRDRVWKFTSARWQADYGYPIYEGNHDEGLFNRSLAINRAALSAGEWDMAIILDADVICEPRSVLAAIALSNSIKGMVIAGDKRVHLSQRATERVLRGYQGDWEQRGFVSTIYHEHWSSCVIVPYSLWEQVGGFDPLFNGWGYEDDAFRCACETMSDHPMLKVSGTIYHLWHPTKHNAAAQRANKDRAQRYWAACWDKEAMRVLLKETVAMPELPPTRIPRILHRTIPKQISEDSERWWLLFHELHPGWELRTYQEPLNPREWPMTGRYWSRCRNGAQKAGLIRLEALVRDGGVYVDSDVQPVRSLEPLLHLPAFAGWEDETTVPDAVMGAEPDHPAFKLMLRDACAAIQSGKDAWVSGPGVSTAILPGRHDVLLLPPGAFYPHHYLQKNASDSNDGPWIFVRHMWEGSWLNNQQKTSIARNQR